mmetsp:Transcript_12157/g.28334  ORF Transcript_12157/g.28334 Transcript_12157/m.28334 type:complete len:431 (+) Transcript_12157:111-1403(+)
MAAALATALQSQASALRPTTTTVMRPDGSRFRLAKDSLGQEVLLPSDGAAEQGQARMPATNSYSGLTKDTGAPLSEDTNSAAAAAADPHTDVSNTSTTAAEDTATSMGTNMDVSACPRFEASDPHMMAHLDEFGYVVVRNAVGSVGNRREAEELLWAFLEEHAGWDRADPTSWTTESFDSVADVCKGILYKRGIGQSDFQWFVRTLPGVRAVFEEVWGTDELLTSFDGCNVFRPWHNEALAHTKTLGGWWHVDQGKNKIGRHAVQGVVTLRAANAQTGGLCVLPGSHRHHERIVGEAEGYTDYVRILEDDPVMTSATPKLVVAEAGDMILWDSRTVHCNTPALETPTVADHSTTDFLRIASYVCMTPREFSDPTIVKVRERGYENRMTTGHWAHLFPTGTCGKDASGRLDLATASEEVRRLVSGLGTSGK